MFERYSVKARRVIFFARHEAGELGSSAIEAHHLLLGLVREDQSTLSLGFPESRLPRFLKSGTECAPELNLARGVALKLICRYPRKQKKL